MDHEISLKDPYDITIHDLFIDLNDKLCQSKEDDMFDQEPLDNNAIWLLDAKYEQVLVKKAAANQKQFNINQHLDLQNVLSKWRKIFDGSHVVYTHQKV